MPQTTAVLDRILTLTVGDLHVLSVLQGESALTDSEANERMDAGRHLSALDMIEFHAWEQMWVLTEMGSKVLRAIESLESS